MAKKRASSPKHAVAKPAKRRSQRDVATPTPPDLRVTLPDVDWKSEATQIVPSATLSSLRQASARPPPEREEDLSPPPSSQSQSSSSGVAETSALNTLRELYAQGDVRGAMALAQELRERIERDMPTITQRRANAVDSPDASIQVEYAGEVSIEVDVSLTGFGGPSSNPNHPSNPRTTQPLAGVGTTTAKMGAMNINVGNVGSTTAKMGTVTLPMNAADSLPHGADAPDASVRLEYGEVDVSLTGLEPFAHDAVDVSISSLVGTSPGVADSPDLSMQGLAGIIDTIESSEHTLEFRRQHSKKELLQRQRLLATELGAVAPLVSMPAEEGVKPLPEVLTSEVPFPHMPGMKARMQQLREEALQQAQQALQVKAAFFQAQSQPTTTAKSQPPNVPSGPPPPPSAGGVRSTSSLPAGGSLRGGASGGGVPPPPPGLSPTLDGHRVPHLIISPSEIASLPIDPRGGFLLAQVDGIQTVNEILDVCAMPASAALELLEQLEALRVIRFQ